jgi:hypothetical protein
MLAASNEGDANSPGFSPVFPAVLRFREREGGGGGGREW